MGNQFWTDVIVGTKITIQISIPKSAVYDDVQINISRAIHGYNSSFVGFGDSAPCNRDVACPEGAGWENEANSVAMLLTSGGTRFCSGSLITSVCQDFTPYFLTAFHCVDENVNGTLSSTETDNVANWVFRFKYQSNSCGGGDALSYVSLNGSTFRAGFLDTDFSLLELATTAENLRSYNLSLSGWSRSTTPATSAVTIHHPAGDVKKISVDDNNLVNINFATIFDGITYPANTHWESIFESGTVQHGSSGAPIFNQNKQIVGQLHGDHLTTFLFCIDRRGQFGRFDVSWTGGGTNATRLSNWLDPNGSGAMSINTLNSPNISGPSTLCSSGTYTLNNVPAGASVTWSVSTPSGVTPTSGSGNIANLTMVNQEDVTLTFTYLNGCSDPIIITKKIIVGPPQFSNFLVDGVQTSNASMCVNSSVYIQAVPNDPSANYSWYCSNPSGSIVTSTFPNTMFYASSPDCYDINLTMSNVCGYNYQNLTICASNCYYRYTVYPNPTTDYIKIDFENKINDSHGLPDDIILISEKSTRTIKTINVQEIFKRGEFKDEKTIEINTSELPRGIYYLHIKNTRRKDKDIDVIRLLLE